MSIPSVTRVKALATLCVGMACFALGGVEAFRGLDLIGLQSHGKCDYVSCVSSAEPYLIAAFVGLAISGAILVVVGTSLLSRGARHR